MGAGYHGGFGNTAGENKHKKAIDNRNPIHKRLIDESLIKELRKNNIKFSEKDILFITKDKTNQIVWLEKGNDGAGFEHIKSRHGRDFAKAFNFSENSLHESLYKVIKYGNVVDDHIEIRNGISSITRVYDYQGTYYLLTGIGTNGFIVTARPQKKEKWYENC